MDVNEVNEVASESMSSIDSGSNPSQHNQGQALPTITSQSGE